MVSTMDDRINKLVKLYNLLERDLTFRTRHIAGIFLGRKLVAIGVNKRKTHPFQIKYGKNKFSVYLHAETMAIHNAIKKGIRIENTTLVVIRYHPKHGLSNSKPCHGCMRCIVEFGIRKLIYS